MHPSYNEFILYLDQVNKDQSVQFILDKLHDNSIDIVTLYNEILTPALYAEPLRPNLRETCIWKEHLRTSIVRTIVECCFPFVLKERTEKYHSIPQGKTVCLCPPGELHDIGARMVADFFNLSGFEDLFLGANTPEDDIIDAISSLRPKFVAISVTNYYNLVSARKAIRRITDLRKSLGFKLILGGQACRANPGTCRQMNPDLILNSFEDIKQLSEGGAHAAT
jgi:MerR family transcriptional regulator, light-induced transcriptional regulator